MPQFRTTSIFRVADLYVDPQLLGQSWSFLFEETPVEFVLPGRGLPVLHESSDVNWDDFANDAVPMTEGGGEVRTSVSIERPDTTRLETFAVRVFLDGEASVRDDLQRASELLGKGVEIAEAVAWRAIAWLRRRQPWLGLAAERPAHMGSRIIDLERRVRLPVTRGSHQVIQPLRAPILFDQSTLAEVVAQVAAARDVDLPEALLDDARYFRSATDEEGAQVAVLLAAIACEVKVKTVLGRVANAESVAMLDLLITSPRDFAQAARALFSQVMDAACGHSLSREDPKLAKRVNRLYETRNKIAHRGHKPPTSDEASECVDTAVAAFGWLDEVRAGEAGPT